MSIDSSEYVSQSSNSGGNRAPPPPFSSQQRKRPALSNLGIEVCLASDIKTPNTPTPNFINEPLDSSDAILKVRPTPTPPTDYSQPTQANIPYYNYQQKQQLDQNNHYIQANQSYSSRIDDIREPQLSIVLEALSDFQNFYDQKTHRIEALEIQLRQVSGQLNQRETELQAASAERISNLKTLETHKIQLRELESQLKDFNKYESIIAHKFENLEILMTDMSSSKAKFLQKESELTKRLEERELKMKEAQKSINELKDSKEELEKQKGTLEDENKDRCIEFNGKIYELNTEIKEKIRAIELLIGEKELLLSDLKNITKDRDLFQKECSMALKEITELAVSDKFSGCDSKDLGNLECSVAWIKSRCMELYNYKLACEVELENLKQTIQELEKHVHNKTGELKEMVLEIEELRSRLSIKEQDLDGYKAIILENSQELESLKEFKRKVISIGVSDEFDEIIEKLSQQTSEHKFESLQNEILQLKRQHELELKYQKEDYGKLLREENSKWKLQREELENEISKLKKLTAIPTSTSTSVMMTRGKASKSQEADLTAIIKDLKESSELLNSNGKHLGKRSSSALGPNNNANSNSSYMNTSNKRRQTNTSTTSHSSQRMSSPSSVNSNDIWSLFK